ncbi:hypothetical protein GCM10028822_34960 [Hymenobacter terrigena]
MSFTSFKNEPIDRMGVKGPLTFNQTAFNLSWSGRPSETYFIQEYLPKGEKAEQFNQMLTLHLFDKDIAVKNAVKQKVQELENRKKTDPICNYQVTEGPDGKEFMVDFLLGESKEDKMTIAEFNIYRFKQVDLGNKKRGILIYSLSKRAYGDDITPFLKNLGKDRIDLLNTMLSTQIPSVKLGGN